MKAKKRNGKEKANNEDTDCLPHCITGPHLFEEKQEERQKKKK
jgi:hypothetical protein